MVIASQTAPLINIPNGGGGVTQPTATAPAVTNTDPELATYQFIAGWILFIIILVFANKSRFGHVIIYYSLVLIILLILLIEYTTVTPLLNSIQTIGQFNQGGP